MYDHVIESNSIWTKKCFALYGTWEALLVGLVVCKILPWGVGVISPAGPKGPGHIYIYIERERERNYV